MPLRGGIRPGDWLYNCQRCGLTIYGSQARREWTGLRDDQTVPFAPGPPHFLLPNEVNYTLDVEVIAEDGSPVLSPDGSTVLASS